MDKRRNKEVRRRANVRETMSGERIKIFRRASDM